MARAWRWLVVLVGVLVLAALPAALSAVPAQQSGISADELLLRLAHSGATPFSGYAEASGGLALPVTRQFSSVADLFGGKTQLRAWSRGTNDWRIDAIGFAGETDVHASRQGTWTWDYESGNASWTGAGGPSLVRLPAAGDLLPTNLARRLLSQASPNEVSRLTSRRVAGRNAPGIRLHPSAAGSTIDHVDVWVDAGTGLALRVDVYGGGSSPVLTSRFLDFSTKTPSAADTAFAPPPTAKLRILDQPDLAAAIDQLGDGVPPDHLAGLARNPALGSFGAIGVYGFGVSEFAAVPLPDRVAFSLTRQLSGSAVETPAGLQTAIGPLSLLLTKPDVTGGSWLLTGTVTPATLSLAAVELPLNTSVR